MDINKYKDIWIEYYKEYYGQGIYYVDGFDKLVSKIVDRLVPVDKDDLKQEIGFESIDYEIELLSKKEKWRFVEFYTIPEDAKWDYAVNDFTEDLWSISNKVREKYLADLEKDEEMER